MAEHPQNVRPARTADRTHNSRRLQAESRPDDAQSANQSYHGHHRAQRHHRAGDARANHRNSGVDRHQTEPTSHRLTPAASPSRSRQPLINSTSLKPVPRCAI